MADSLTPGGAGLPEDPGGMAAVPPEVAPPEAGDMADAAATDGPTAEAAASGAATTGADVTGEAAAEAAATPVADPWASPAAEPAVSAPALEGSAGFGMPAGMSTGAAAGGVAGGTPAPGTTDDWSAPPAGWAPGGGAGMAAAAAVTPAKRKLPIRLIIAVAVVIAIIAVVVVVTRGQKNASDLTIGDCFVVPTKTVDIDTVKAGPCTEPHSGEIFFIATYPDAATYPAESDFEQFAEATCGPVYTTYVGASIDTTPDLTVGFFFPQSDGWASGDRTMKCYVTRVDGATVTKSVKGSAGNP